MKKLLSALIILTLGLNLSAPALAYLSEGKTIEGSQKELRLGKNDQFGPGPLAVQDAHAKYAEAVARGNVYYCANLAGTSVTTQAGLSATTPALTLYNPINSGKNLVIWEVAVAPTAAPAAAAQFMVAVSTYGLTGGPQSTTAGTLQNALLGLTSAAGAAQCYRIATLGNAPVAIRYIGGTTGAAAISGLVINDPTDGKIVVSPGAAISIQSTSAAAIISHYLFEEVPL